LDIFCRLSEPDQGPARRIVLGVHGLGGSTDDAIQAGIAEEMALFGAVTLRFDFPAHGRSPLDSDAFNLDNCRNSLLCVARYAREQYPDTEDLCIFATGFGAYITLLCLEDLLEMPGKVKLVIQTPALRMHETLLAMRNISQQTFRSMDALTFPTKRPFSISYRFFKEMQENIALVTYPIPILILHGEEDAYIRSEDIRNFNRINELSKLVIIPGTSHQFLEPGAWDMVLDLTRDWFEFEQVLLSDWT
jgi:alpha-beta hydrolase superfamily lysophospholipase